jgi:2-keto-4-pentenoate hydratase/2-oxohepta-3-ene-1,7-dioic acid hydratase in catechol pathway
MDYELEIAVVIGRIGRDLRPDEALDHVLGVTIMNDLSARDVQAREMTAGFGPAKGKDFGTAIGPWITTLDELDLGDLTMLAGSTVRNGREGRPRPSRGAWQSWWRTRPAMRSSCRGR